MNKKIVAFEEISHRNRWLVLWYLFLKKRIYFIRLHCRVKNKKWVYDLLKAQKLIKISEYFNLHVSDGYYFDLAYENIDCFHEEFTHNPIVKKCQRLYENKDIEQVFLKTFHYKLGRFYYLNYVINYTQQKNNNAKITFIPLFDMPPYVVSDGCEIYDYRKIYKIARKRSAQLYDTEGVHFPFLSICFSYLNALMRRIKISFRFLGYLFYPVSIILRNICSPKTYRKIKEKYKYAVMIIHPGRQIVTGSRKVDFLIDGCAITKEKTLFLYCKKLPQKGKKYMQENRLNYLDNIDRFIKLKEYLKTFPTFTSCLKHFIAEDYIIHVALQTMFFYIRWNSLMGKIRIQNLITYSDFGIQSVARNIILEKYNTTTYFYLESSNFPYEYIKMDDKKKHRPNLYGYLYYDYFLLWDDFFRKILLDLTKCKIRNYLNVGCLWAEHVRLIGEGKIPTNLKEKLYAHGYDRSMKVLAVFDTYVHDDTTLPTRQGVEFVKGLLRLLENNKDFFMILKKKYPAEKYAPLSMQYDNLLNSYHALENHPRCYSITAWIDTSELIAASDLVISLTFTSLTVEAVSARRKAIYYDASCCFRDTYYDTIPGLVCHSYEELASRVKVLLQMPEDEYNSYLNKYVKGKIEDYLDGRAITRFREHLNSEGIKNSLQYDYADSKI